MKNLVQVIKPDKLNIVQVVNRTYRIQFKLSSQTCRIQFKQSGQTCRIRLKHSSQTCRIRIKHSRQTCRIMVKQLSQTCRFQLMQSIQTYRIQFKQSIQTCRIRVKQSIQTFRIQFPGGNFFPDSIPECPEHVVVIHYSTTLHHPLSLLCYTDLTLPLTVAWLSRNMKVTHCSPIHVHTPAIVCPHNQYDASRAYWLFLMELMTDSSLKENWWCNQDAKKIKKKKSMLIE